MKYFTTIILVIFLFTPTFAAGSASDIQGLIPIEELLLEEAPGRFDWSLRQRILSVKSTSHPPPVVMGENLHIVSFDNDENLLYVAINYQGEELVRSNLTIQDLTSKSHITHALGPEGVVIIWSFQGDDEFLLYGTWLDGQGEIIRTKPLEFAMPDSRWVPSSPNLYALQAVIDDDGLLHLGLHIGHVRASGIIYLRFSPEGQALMTELISNSGTAPSNITLGRIDVDNRGNVFLLSTRTNHVDLSQVTIQGEHIQYSNLLPTIHHFGGDTRNVYASRSIPPAMAVDSSGVVHIATNFVTRGPGLGPPIVDVLYTRFHQGAIISQQVITQGQGMSHFPGLTISQDKVYITWEQAQGNANELFYRIYDTQGDEITRAQRFTWERAPSRLGLIFGDDQGELAALWWSTYQGESTLSFKSTLNPVPPSPWQSLGFVTDDPDNSITSQLAFYTPIVLAMAFAGVVTHLHIILYLAIAIFILHKIGMLHHLLGRSLSLFILCLLVMFLLLPTAEDPHWQLFSGLAASVLLFLTLLIGKVKIKSASNLILSCLLWLFLLMVMQVLPMVPNQFAL